MAWLRLMRTDSRAARARSSSPTTSPPGSTPAACSRRATRGRRTSPSAPGAGGRARGTCSADCWIPALADRAARAEYSFRLFVSMETGDARYNHTNTKMSVASGARMGARVVYDAYLV